MKVTRFWLEVLKDNELEYDGLNGLRIVNRAGDVLAANHSSPSALFDRYFWDLVAAEVERKYENGN